MEKEMKKLLLVAVSVGVFLLVTITVALIVLTPRAQNESFTSSSIPYSQGRILPAPDANKGVEEPVIKIDDTKIEVTEVTQPVDTNNGDSITIQITAPVLNDTQEKETQVKTTTTTAAPKQTSSGTTVVKIISAKTTTTKTTTAKPSAAKPAATRAINDYWIQIGAYRAMVRAEDARELLASKGLVSIIENREINGQNLYRVRLGPYTSEREANHWLAIVKNIDGLHESQVRQSVR